MFLAVWCYTKGTPRAQQGGFHPLLCSKKNSGKYFARSDNLMHSVSSLREDYSIPETLERWRLWLYEQDRSAGTIKKYLQAVTHFLEWYEQEERIPLQLAALTPIALIGYRNELQHEQHKSVSTINLRISALRAWCA